MNKLVLTLATLIFLLLPQPAQAATDVNNFTIENYQIDYHLGRDAEGRSTLKTIESISAKFPQTDQNHGLERAIPDTYDGHSTSLTVDSVTDADGQPLPYETDSEGKHLLVRIGDADRYVHGLQHYKITYTQRDVTKFYADTNRDEFYWDTNGTEWQVPIRNLAVRLHIDSALTENLTGDNRCYKGQAGATTTCALSQTSGGVSAQASNLAPGENLTVALGFQPSTFATYQPTLGEKLFKLWWMTQLALLPLVIGLIVWCIVRYEHQHNRTKDRGTIVTEFLPPPNTSVSVAGSILHKPGKIFSAQLIDFAVRHYIKIYQTRQKTWLKPANYELEIIKDISDLKPEEREIFTDIFPQPTIGARLDMEKLHKNHKLAQNLNNNKKKVDQKIAGVYGLRERNKQQSKWFLRAGFAVLAGAIVTLSPLLLIASIILFVCSETLRPLTDAGLALWRHLQGLERYIAVAEADRLQILQSPEGAARLNAPVDTNDQRQMIKLYERVLPYAILFGKEKEWNERLGRYYQEVNESPDWYSGGGAFNAAIFSASLSNFASVAAYSDPTNASSGGSSGGGSSGGGGGGGGGGGW